MGGHGGETVRGAASDSNLGFHYHVLRKILHEKPQGFSSFIDVYLPVFTKTAGIRL